jgi:hypothetical protein
MKRLYVLLLFACCVMGCVRLFGWTIHAPGILSESFYHKLQPAHARIALFIPNSVAHFESHNKGGRTADPQVYYLGESLVPMLIEAFQYGFDEFISMEVEPTPAIVKQYAIEYIVVIKIKDFANRVTMHGQYLSLTTEVVVYNSAMQEVACFDAEGKSDARKVFSKKGGPEVNLNASLETNSTVTVQYLQDLIKKIPAPQGANA